MKRLPIIFPLIALAACAGPDHGGPPEGWTVDTLPNGAVRVTNLGPEGGQEPEGWRLEPELVLGGLDAPEEETFGAISGLEVDDEGRIYVLDRETSRLGVFSPEGEPIRAVGRRGEGPGEYVSPNGLLWLTPDTLAVVDQEGDRYSLLDREGTFVRSIPRQLGFFAWAFRGGLRDGRLFEQFSVPGPGDERRPVFIATALTDGPLEGGDGARDTIHLPVGDWPGPETFSIRTDQGGMVMSVPFTPAPVYRVDPDGGLWHGHGGEFRLVRSSLEGDALMEILLETDPHPVSDEELEAWLASESVERFRQMGGDLEVDRIPEAKPHFDGLHVDGDGYLWVSVPAGPREAVFAVFDPEGRYRTHLRIHGVERAPWMDPVVRNGRLYLPTRDELEVPGVHVFRIQR